MSEPTEALRTTARQFLDALNPAGRAAAVSPFAVDDRKVWTYLPGPRPGVAVGDLSDTARAGLPPVIERAARHAVPVSFASLAASALTGHLVHTGAGLAPLVAVAVAVVAVRRTGSPHAALAAGMPTLWVMSVLLPA